jgi:hypothetical protein
LAAAYTGAAATDRNAYAAAAGCQRQDGSPRPCLDEGGDVSAPQDAAAFADAVFACVDPVAIGAGLLRSEDERIRQRQLERLLDLKYGKSGAVLAEEAPRFEPDIPRPNRG